MRGENYEEVFGSRSQKTDCGVDASIEKLFVYYNDIVEIVFAPGRMFFVEFNSIIEWLMIFTGHAFY